MRPVRTCYCLLLCAVATLASSSRDETPGSTDLAEVVQDGSPTSREIAPAPSELSTTLSPEVTSDPTVQMTSTEVQSATESNPSIPTPSISLASTVDASASTAIDSVTATTPLEPTSAPSTRSASEPSSPPRSEPSLTLSETPSIAIPSPPSISLVTEIPLASIPPVPEFLSFNEWKEKYVVVPDPSIALARRAKKAAQRQRQDVVGAETVGDRGAAYDGDGADLGSLFASSGEEIGTESSTRAQGREEGATREEKRPLSAMVRDDPLRRSGAPSNSLSPIQPLPNVGSGDEHDPLVPLKDRSNYAAFECAAMVHRSSRKTKGASAILVEKKDRYMLTPCAADPKFVEVELCDEIQIDTIVLANFEFFSSMFKHFKASCSVNYPGNADDWHDLGTFRARNVRGVQVFRPNLIPNFCRYIRINFLSHFGSEYYCPVSLLRVYGYTQLDAYRESERKARQLQEALAAAEEYPEDEAEDPADVERPVEEHQTPSVEVDEPRDHSRFGEREVVQNETLVEEVGISSAQVDGPTSTDPNPVNDASATPVADQLSIAVQVETSISAADVPATASTKSTTAATPRGSQTAPADSDPQSQPATSGTPLNRPVETIISATSTEPASENASPESTRNQTATLASSAIPTASAAPDPKSINSTSVTLSSAAPAVPSSSGGGHSRPADPSDLPIINARPVVSRNETAPIYPHVPVHRAPVISPPLQQPQPGESIYATIMKRLTSLEHNQTLSMHFMEAQSGQLREAFMRIERRLSDVEATRSRQEQGIRQALLELEKERNELQRERLGLTTQVGMLAQEIRLEKRLSALQLVGTLLLIIFVGFTRSIPTSPFLHLASSAQSQRRDPVQRGSEELDEPQVSAEDRSSPDLAKKPLGRRSSGAGNTKYPSGHSKRFPSMSKPGPRRHYGTGTSSSSRTPAFVKSPRAWTPPLRHSSAPPEDAPLASTSTALEGREARRRGSNRRPGSPFEFPRRSKLDTQLGLAIEPVLPHSLTTASPASFGERSPTALSRRGKSRDVYSSTTTIGDAVTTGDLDHYTTTDDEDEPPLPPIPPTQLPPPLVFPVPSSPPSYATTSSNRPPNPTLPSRPSTSMGIPLASSGSPLPSKSDGSFSRRSPQRRVAHDPPTPPSALPSPPPEPDDAFHANLAK